MRKAIFIDKDGTLIKDVPFNVDLKLIVFEEGAITGLKRLSVHDYLFIIITNQVGIAHGYFSEQELLQVESYISFLLMKDSIKLDGFYFCPHYPGGRVPEYDINCKCRKPLPGLLLEAASDLGIDLSQSWMIGDILNDVEAGNRAGCRTILIDNGNETEWVTDPPIRTPSYIAKDWKEVSDFILHSTLSKHNNIISGYEQ